jgi:hypothetical protein
MTSSPRRLVIALENLSFAAISMAVLTGAIWGAAIAAIICGRLK